MISSRKIFVTFQKEGIHCYPAAATDPTLNRSNDPVNKWLDVSFLAHPHRHIFHFTVWVDVEHNDRDIEFIQFKRWLENLYNQTILEVDHKSCEMLAEDLIDQISQWYPGRKISVIVSEDGENGAQLEYEPD